MTQTLTEQIDEKKLNLIFTDEKPREWAHDEHYVLLRCPCCYRCWWEGYGRNYYGFETTKGKAIWEIVKHLVLHIVCEVRLKGEVKHMKLLIKLFGKQKGKELLKRYAARSIIVARNINKFLKTLK